MFHLPRSVAFPGPYSTQLPHSGAFRAIFAQLVNPHGALGHLAEGNDDAVRRVAVVLGMARRVVADPAGKLPLQRLELKHVDHTHRGDVIYQDVGAGGQRPTHLARRVHRDGLDEGVAGAGGGGVGLVFDQADFTAFGVGERPVDARALTTRIWYSRLSMR